MINKTFFKKSEDLYTTLTHELEQVELENHDEIRISELSLFKIDEAIRILKELVSDIEFESAALEIHFFKNIKPKFISNFIYHSRLIEIQTYKPAAGEEAQRDYLHKQIEKLTLFYNNNIEFYSYYRREATYLDAKYFIRNRYDLKMTLPTGLYNYDEKFTTSHDHLIAQIIANQQIEQYLKFEIEKISTREIGHLHQKSTISWSESKVYLVELIYGLYQMKCFNGGNVELSEVMKFAEKSMQIDLGNYHKTIFEIRNRKKGPTKFIQLVNDHLIKHFAVGDEE